MPDETVSTGVALVLITLDISSLVFSFVTHRELPISIHGLADRAPNGLFFTGFEIAVVGLSSAIVALIALDGRSN